MEGVIGEIRLWASNFAPRWWSFCDGRLIAVYQNTALFSILGTTYGGDGRTTFALPDLRGRAPLGWGQGTRLPSYFLGQRGGVENVALTLNEIPAHNHAVQASGAVGTLAEAAGAYPAGSNASSIYAANGSARMMPTISAGASIGHDNMMPFTALNYIICLQGIYPMRS